MKIECMPKENDTDEDVIRKIYAINGFNCNLYVLVNFTAQAESGLKLLDQNILEMNDIENSPFINPNCCDFVRTATKLCVPGADEKSGYGLLCKTFLNQLKSPVELKLTTFHGHTIILKNLLKYILTKKIEIDQSFLYSIMSIILYI